MDERGRCMDNIFIKRLWRSLKYEAVYPHEMTSDFVTQKIIAVIVVMHPDAQPLL